MASQCLFTFLIAPPNQSLLAIRSFALILLLTVITIADFCLLFLAYYSLRQFLLINQRGIVFNEILVEDLTPLLNSSNFFGLTYLSNDIL